MKFSRCIIWERVLQETTKEIKEFQQIKNCSIKKALLKGVHELATRLSNSLPMAEKKRF